MTPLLAALAAFSLVAGVLLLVVGLVPAVPGETAEASGPGPITRLQHRWRTASRRQRIHLVVALVLGLVVYVASGWVVALVVVPLVVLGLPQLLGEPGNRDIAILEALDRWVRSLTSSLPTGKSIPDAMRATAGQAPPLIGPQVRLMIARLDDRWTQRDALTALADDLDCPEADAVIASLILSAQRGGVGAATTLAELAATIQDRLRALREIEVERSKPRVVVRQVTVISAVVLGAAMLLSPQFFTPFGSPLGQVLLASLLAAYVVPLLVLRRMTIPRRRDRILRRATPGVQHA